MVIKPFILALVLAVCSDVNPAVCKNPLKWSKDVMVDMTAIKGPDGKLHAFCVGESIGFTPVPGENGGWTGVGHEIHQIFFEAKTKGFLQGTKWPLPIPSEFEKCHLIDEEERETYPYCADMRHTPLVGLCTQPLPGDDHGWPDLQEDGK